MEWRLQVIAVAVVMLRQAVQGTTAILLRVADVKAGEREWMHFSPDRIPIPR